ncbi:MAG: hypothetical protein MNSN_06360 [Minisyncoccus archaeiphilus]|uniref:hypothetical protein n=1 Tax=Minisyncoccus archaeiphilus TaxID=3238481 RepID=UPI0009CD8CA6|nr:MAG: hypothetical protein BWY21_00974 [Parcubacteria group bacterium ADurb.Bin216]GMX59632.1 MAG: hypothetical protein MNSN_06360 [Candidatus Parcubacteria bacterium]
MDIGIFFIYLLRKLAFGIAVGYSLYSFFLFARPIIESATLATYEDDFWFWSVVAGSVVFGFLAFLII